jgi:hypothetical protein
MTEHDAHRQVFPTEGELEPDAFGDKGAGPEEGCELDAFALLDEDRD